LKLAELRGRMSEQQQQRWEDIKRGFGRRQTLGNDDDPVMRVSNVLGKVSENLDVISDSIHDAAARMGQGPDFSPILEKLSNGPMLVKLSPDSDIFQALSQSNGNSPDLSPFLQTLNQTMVQLGRHMSHALEKANGNGAAPPVQLDLSPVLDRIGQALERMTPAAPSNGAAAAQADLTPVLDRIGLALERLGSVQQPVVAAAPAGVAGQAAASVVHMPAPDLSPVLNKLSQAIEKMSGAAPARAPLDLTPVLHKLTQAIETMSRSAPRVVDGAAPVSVAAHPAPAIQLAPEAASAMVGSLDNMMHIVPKLKQLGARLRGPRAKVILMDAELVRTFDAFKEINTLADAVRALEQLDG
jgi:hypothetical protein